MDKKVSRKPDCLETHLGKTFQDSSLKIRK